MAGMNPRVLSMGLFLGMTAVGTTVVPIVTKRATQKAAKQHLTIKTSKIDFDNMGPEIVKKDRSEGEDS